LSLGYRGVFKFYIKKHIYPYILLLPTLSIGIYYLHYLLLFIGMSIIDTVREGGGVVSWDTCPDTYRHLFRHLARTLT